MSPAAAMQAEVIGSYRLRRALGRGATADVYVGEHVRTRHLAAVKIAKRGGRSAANDAWALAHEHRTIAALRHPHIAGVLELGERHIATRYVPGVDLARRLASPLALADALRITRQIASALAHAHARGVVHRDVKPSNVLLDVNGDAFLVDFGAAMFERDAGPHEGFLVGTPSFWAPEQARGERVGPLADQYALGRTLVAMLLGGKAPDPRLVAPLLRHAVPEPLVTPVLRALAEDPEARWPDVDALDAALAVAAAQLEVAPSEPERIAWEESTARTRARGGTRASSVHLGSLLRPLVPPRRSAEPFAWCAHAESTRVVERDFMRADHRLSALRGSALDAERVDAFLHEAGYEDLGWASYAWTPVLGPCTDPRALARATSVVVMVHGLFGAREVWQDLAVALARDDARRVVLVPDMMGFGTSRFAEHATAAHAGPRALVQTLLDWLRLLGVGEDMPVVIVGHSLGAFGILAAGDDMIPPHVHRLAISPVWLFEHPAYRALFRFVARAGSIIDARPSLKRFIAQQAERAPYVANLHPNDRAFLREQVERTPAKGVSLIYEAFGSLSSTPPTSRLERAAVMISEDDPIAPADAVMRAVAALGVPPERTYLLEKGGHFPFMSQPSHPEWCTSTAYEVARLVDLVLDGDRERTMVTRSGIQTSATSAVKTL